MEVEHMLDSVSLSRDANIEEAENVPSNEAQEVLLHSNNDNCANLPDNDKDIIQSLEATVDKQAVLIQEKNIFIQNLEDKLKLIHQNNADLQSKLDQAVKEKLVSIKEKESMVMKYAVSEKHVFEQKSAKEKVEKKLQEMTRENELLQHKLNTMNSEKARICQMLDNKCYELKTSQQEVDRLKSDLSALETKLKWSQNSLKTEIELRKESDAKVEKLSSRIQESIQQIEEAKRQSEQSIKTFQTSQENKAYVLDQQLKEQQATLILLRHEKDDREHQVKTLQSDLDRIHSKHKETLNENNTLSVKVQQLEKDRLENELKLRELRGCADQQRQDVVNLNSKTVQLEQLKLQLNSEHEQLSAANEQISLLKQRNNDLETDMESCRIRESDMLSFTQQLTDKNVRLQSEFTAIETKVQQLTCEQAILKRSIKEHETKASLLSTQLSEDKKKFTEDVNKLTSDLEDKSQKCERYLQEVADQKGENMVIKRKLEHSLKEVNKELQQCRKKLEKYESSDVTSSASSSSSSLNHMENCHADQVKVVQPEKILDKETLIEHIVKLQRISAKKSEKIDFLEEHVSTLVVELQKKSRLLQSYILREQTGALSSNAMDNNKADLARLPGIMASMYSARVVDNNLTLELSLDINRKLQAVLEDALLKNMTLKENVDTLGMEIERLNNALKS